MPTPTIPSPGRTRADLPPPLPQPFLLLSKSASSPRAAADLVARATAAPGAYVFAELLETPSVAALAASPPEYAAYHVLLEIFSHGTYETYVAHRHALPPLDDAQVLKLRLLSLLSLARDRRNLSYDALCRRLGLDSHRHVETLVITAIYAGLVEATLDPARHAIQVTSIAPLRDLSPGTIPEMISILGLWSDRCTSTLDDLEAQIQGIRDAAVERETEAAAAEQRLQEAIEEAKEGGDKKHDGQGGQQREVLSKRQFIKRAVAQSGVVIHPDAETLMELDEPAFLDERRSSKRKM